MSSSLPPKPTNTEDSSKMDDDELYMQHIMANDPIIGMDGATFITDVKDEGMEFDDDLMIDKELLEDMLKDIKLDDEKDVEITQEERDILKRELQQSLSQLDGHIENLLSKAQEARTLAIETLELKDSEGNPLVQVPPNYDEVVDMIKATPRGEPIDDLKQILNATMTMPDSDRMQAELKAMQIEDNRIDELMGEEDQVKSRVDQLVEQTKDIYGQFLKTKLLRLQAPMTMEVLGLSEEDFIKKPNSARPGSARSVRSARSKRPSSKSSVRSAASKTRPQSSSTKKKPVETPRVAPPIEVDVRAFRLTEEQESEVQSILSVNEVPDSILAEDEALGKLSVIDSDLLKFEEHTEEMDDVSVRDLRMDSVGGNLYSRGQRDYLRERRERNEVSKRLSNIESRLVRIQGIPTAPDIESEKISNLVGELRSLKHIQNVMEDHKDITTEEVLEAIGIKKPNIEEYFQSQNELIEEVDDVINEFEETLDADALKEYQESISKSGMDDIIQQMINDYEPDFEGETHDVRTDYTEEELESVIQSVVDQYDPNIDVNTLGIPDVMDKM
ncbi:hypothetical protein PCE1_001676 [Barthelona sp. PCE]